MPEITISMTDRAYREYLKKDGGLKCREELVTYLNAVGGYMGNIIDVVVEEAPMTAPMAEMPE